jgi:cytochrome c551/c552
MASTLAFLGIVMSKRIALWLSWYWPLVLMAVLLAACGSHHSHGGGAARPSITAQPASVTVAECASASFTVVAVGGAPLSYQWQRDGSAIAGATAASYTIAEVAATDNGARFTVVVSNAAGSVVSDAATLSVGVAVAPAIVSQPEGQSVVAPASAHFSVEASGSAPLAYQWRRNGEPIVGATGPAYATPATAVADTGARYSVRVSNSAGVATSQDAILTVSAADVAPSISIQPQDVTVNPGQSAAFSVVARGTGPLAYQWRRNGLPIAGANGPRYATAPAVLADNGALFSVEVSNAAATVTSGNAVLTVVAGAVAPAITMHPANATAIVGSAASFTVAASGTAPLAYQWRRNGTDIAGATAASYTTPATALANDGDLLQARVSNAAGVAFSNEARLTVLASGPIIDLLRQKNCLACHAQVADLVGPSWAEIGARFAGRRDQEPYLVERIRFGGSGAWGPIPMPANPQVSADEAGLIARWLTDGAPAGQ